MADRKLNDSSRTSAALEALNEADQLMQEINRFTEATVEAVRGMLSGKDSAQMRMGVMTIIERLDTEAFGAMNRINCLAEECGVNHTNDRLSDMHRALCDGARLSIEEQGVGHG